MLKRYSYFIAVILIPSLCLPAPVMAAIAGDGEVIVRVDEDNADSRCINSSTDKITMHLRRMVINKDAGLFTEAKEAGLLINTFISGEDANKTSRKISLPKMYLVTVSPYQSGRVSLPIEENLFSRFPLNNEGNTYDSVKVEYTVIVKKDKNPLGTALSVLAEISKDLPAPMNPFSEGFKYFSDYANKMVAKSLDKGNNVADASKEGQITLAFSETGICKGEEEKTGTLAAVRAAKGSENDGFVDINKDYCWRAELRPVFTLKFANSEGRDKCNALPEGKFKPVSNPYLAFYLNAQSKVPAVNVSSPEVKITPAAYIPGEHHRTVAGGDFMHNWGDSFAEWVSPFMRKLGILQQPQKGGTHDVILTPEAYGSQARDRIESLKRCAAHGVSQDNCF